MTKKRSKNLWLWIIDSCKGKKKLSRTQRTHLASVAGLGSLILTVLVFTRAHRETVILFDESLARTEAIQAMLDSQDFGYAIMDESGKIIEWNPALERLTHWSEKEVKAKGLEGLMSDKTTFEGFLKAVFSTLGDGKLDGNVAVVRWVIAPHDAAFQPLPVRITSRAVQSKRGRRYAIVHIDKAAAVKELGMIQ